MGSSSIWMTFRKSVPMSSGSSASMRTAVSGEEPGGTSARSRSFLRERSGLASATWSRGEEVAGGDMTCEGIKVAVRKASSHLHRSSDSLLDGGSPPTCVRRARRSQQRRRICWDLSCNLDQPCCKIRAIGQTLIPVSSPRHLCPDRVLVLTVFVRCPPQASRDRI